jgi:hypothetical protein
MGNYATMEFFPASQNNIFWVPHSNHVFLVFFLLLSIYFFLNKTFLVAAGALGVASVFHPIYLIAAFLLMTIYSGICLLENRNLKTMVLSWLLFGALVWPIVTHNLILFSSTDSRVRQQAMEILYNLRNPHHSNVQTWFNHKQIYKFIIIGLAIMLVRKSNLFWIMTLLYAFILISIPILYFFPNPVLCLAGPWRVSLILQLLAMGILGGWIAVKSSSLLETLKVKGSYLKKITFVLVAVSFFMGVYHQIKIIKVSNKCLPQELFRFVKKKF